MCAERRGDVARTEVSPVINSPSLLLEPAPSPCTTVVIATWVKCCITTPCRREDLFEEVSMIESAAVFMHAPGCYTSALVLERSTKYKPPGRDTGSPPPLMATSGPESPLQILHYAKAWIGTLRGRSHESTNEILDIRNFPSSWKKAYLPRAASALLSSPSRKARKASGTVTSIRSVALQKPPKLAVRLSLPPLAAQTHLCQSVRYGYTRRCGRGRHRWSRFISYPAFDISRLNSSSSIHTR